MGALVYAGSVSLDGYISDAAGGWEWATPDAEVHTFFNELTAPTRTHLYGRRMYEVMSWWDQVALDDLPEAERAFARLWRDIDKIVYSRDGAH